MLFKKDNSKKLTIIIITFNSEGIIETCLKDIISDNFDIIVVDNASSDKTIEKISTFKNVKIISLKQNLGYGRAANYGLKAAKTQHSLLLNPDVKTNRETIKNLLDQSKKFPSAVVVAPKSLKNIDEKDVERLEWVSGATMLFNMNLLKKIGFFDENIFLFYEETDLCKRIINAGYEIYRFNNIVMDHIIGASTTNKYQVRYARYWHTGWSMFYFNKKHQTHEKFLKTVTETIQDYAKQINLAKDNEEKLMQYTAMLLGGTSFLAGVNAFDENGDPTIKPE